MIHMKTRHVHDLKKRGLMKCILKGFYRLTIPQILNYRPNINTFGSRIKEKCYQLVGNSSHCCDIEISDTTCTCIIEVIKKQRSGVVVLFLVSIYE